MLVSSCCGKNRLRAALLIITVASVFVVQPVAAEPPSYHIRAYFTQSQLGYRIEARLIYGVDPWYYDQHRPGWFDITVELPADRNLTLTIEQIYIFLDFTYDYYEYEFLNETSFDSIQITESGEVYNTSIDLCVVSSVVLQHFTPDLVSDYAVLGFLVVFSSQLRGETCTSYVYSRNLYSYRPASHDWNQGHYIYRPHDNVAGVFVGTILYLLFNNLLWIVIFALLGMCVFTERAAIRNRVAPHRLPYKHMKIGRQKVHLGGEPVALAYLVRKIAPNLSTTNSTLRTWAQEQIGIEFPAEINTQALHEDERRIWKEVSDWLWGNAKRIAERILKEAKPGMRGKHLLQLLEKANLQLSEDEQSVLIQRAEHFFHRQRRRWWDNLHRWGWDVEELLLMDILDDAYLLVRERLDALHSPLRNQLNRIVSLLVKGRTESDWINVGQGCRTFLQDLTERLLKPDMLLPTEERPEKRQTYNKIKLLLKWIVRTLEGHGNKEADFLKKSCKYIGQFFWGLKEIVEKTAHLESRETTENDAKRCVIYIILWVEDLIQLLDRAGYIWDSATN